MEYNTKIMEVVRSYDGTEARRGDCRYIKGQYYIKEKQCFLINDQWYRITNPDVVYDNEQLKWVLKSETPNLIWGIIAVSKSKPTLGYFSGNSIKNVDVYYKDTTYFAINEEILINSGSVLEGVNGKYFFKMAASKLPKTFTTKLKPHKEGFYRFPFNYGSEPLIPSFLERFNNNFRGDELLSSAYELLSGYTFGVEFETERGAIPEKHLLDNGLIACRDGSITGFEYATVPLSGKTGIQAIKRSCSLLNKYCGCSPSESLHIHIGGYPRTIKNISALYRLGLIIQDEIYSLFPYYYTNTANFKRKGYCNPLYVVGTESITAKEIFSGIYSFLSGSDSKFIRFPVGTHPMDRSGQHKWEISPRYIWLNLIPLIWGLRGTIEFRCHPPTVKAQKVINWLFILIAIIKFAKLNSNDLVYTKFVDLPVIKLSSILKEFYPKDICIILNGYIDLRKEHYSCRKDNIGELEIFSEEHGDIFQLTEFV